MIAKLAYLVTLAILYVRREVIVGKNLAELQATTDCEDGYSSCGMPMDDHDQVECETEVMPLWGDDEES